MKLLMATEIYFYTYLRGGDKKYGRRNHSECSKSRVFWTGNGIFAGKHFTPKRQILEVMA